MNNLISRVTTKDEAKDRIKDFVNKHPDQTFFYLYLADELNISLELVVESCKELLNEGFFIEDKKIT